MITRQQRKVVFKNLLIGVRMASEDINQQTMAASLEETGQTVNSTIQQENNVRDPNSTKLQNHGSRQNNILRIQQRKQQMHNWPQVKKFLKLAGYSACQAEECKCTGWKTVQPITKSQKGETQQPVINFFDPCRLCEHTLENHIKHLSAQPDDEINRLLGMAVDADNISPFVSERMANNVRYGENVSALSELLEL
ncbi:histone acetyltransferase kat2a [Lasius niger]|uniref:Histone acetyltransferase kat2a n=1 Tax=Lasius niger TaxID=67767 RepID=A0A0J7KNN8_LASNI|nr:histone acetyltransferase kat2a [Lasius niger]